MNKFSISKLKNSNGFLSLNTKSNIAKIISLVVACLSGVILIGIVSFIFAKAIMGFNEYGFKNILGTSIFELNSSSSNGVSFWSPFSATLITSSIALLIAVPLGIKTSIFIKFRVNKKYRKFLRVTIETLAGIPSVIFGLFASESLKSLVNLFGISSYSIINASIMLAFMILPTIIAMTYNSLENVNIALLNHTIALGCTKTKAIYKVYKKVAKSGIIVGIILAIGRAIGETMALSMLLQSESNYSQVLSSGNLFEVLGSNIKTISVVISTNMFTENSTEQTKSLLFAFGFILFVFIMILNLIVLKITSSKSRKNKHLIKMHDSFFLYSKKFVNFFFSGFEYLFFPFKRTFKINTTNDAIYYMNYRTQNYKLRDLYSWYKIMLEILSVLICFVFLSWLTFEIIIPGISAWSSPTSTVFLYTKNSTGQAFLNTILIIIVSIFVGFPLSLFTAIYVNEFSKNKYAKKTIGFFLDSLGATPSILFGMFGLIFFIETLHWTSQGDKGFSLIAGALTVSIVILPTFTRAIQQALIEVPNEMRLNGLALGASTLQVVVKIILPAALVGLVTSVILAIGRILSETAPLYLTAGLTSSKQTALTNSGQTLTTRIYAQLTNTNINESLNIMYESAFLTLILVFMLVILGYYIIPNWRTIKKDLLEKYQEIKAYFKTNMIIKKKEASYDSKD